FEIILVNDGSTDNSLEIGKKLKTKYGNINLIDKPNGGASSARNEGIRKATGKYILFIDSDDYLTDPQALYSLSQNIKSNNPDLILFGVTTHNEINGQIKSRVQYFNDDIEYLNAHTFIENLNYLHHKNKNPTSSWSVAIRRSYLLNNNLFFKE